MNENCYTIANGVVGFAASLLGVLSTFQEQLEWWMRMTGGSLGILVALITLYNLIKKKP